MDDHGSASSLDAYDHRNPLFYVLRAGYPPTHEDFYTIKDGKPKYDQAAFVRGFNLTVGEFFALKKKVCFDLVDKGLIDTKRGSLEWKIATTAWLRELEEDERLSRVPKEHTGWKAAMIYKFVKSVADWWYRHAQDDPPLRIENGQLVNVPLSSKWSLAQGYEYPKFKGLYQFQHMTIRFTCTVDDNKLLRLNIPVKLLYSTNSPLTPIDKGLDDVSYDKTISTLKNRPEVQALGTDGLKLTHTTSTGKGMSIVTNDEQLRSAVRGLRRLNNDVVHISVWGAAQSIPGIKSKMLRPRDSNSDEEPEMRPAPRRRRVRKRVRV